MDIRYLLLLQQFREATGGIFDKLFLGITSLGGATTAIIVATFLYLCIDKSVGEYIIFNSLIGNVVNGFLKITFCVFRPWMRDTRIKPLRQAIKGATGYSFPSGHTTSAVALWGGLAVKYRKRRSICILGTLLWLLIGFSRNYVGVHTPQDVIVAAALGLILLWVCEKIQELLAEKPERDLFVASILIAMGLILMIYANVKSYPMDTIDGVLVADPEKLRIDSFSAAGSAIGFALGWMLERRKVHLKVDGSLICRCIRFVAAVISVLLIKKGAEAAANAVLPPQYAAALSMALLIFWLIGLFPMLINILRKRNFLI